MQLWPFLLAFFSGGEGGVGLYDTVVTQLVDDAPTSTRAMSICLQRSLQVRGAMSEVGVQSVHEK